MKINDVGIKMRVQPENTPIKMKVKEHGSGGTSDYLDLYNKPSINGKELIGNFDEEDPTVHPWAKEALKPEYTAEEVGAVSVENEMSFADIKSAWDTIFNMSKGRR